MRIFISTGEVSGDLQGAMLVDALLRQAAKMDKSLEIVALGGDRMAAAGANILGNTTAIGSVGTIESLPFVLPTIQIQRRAKEYLKQNPPDVLILIDYMGPNLAIGAYVRKYLPSVPIVYYIAPQDWVWVPRLSKNRGLRQLTTRLLTQSTSKIVEITDRLLAIFPEEANYFQQQGVNVTWVGHPLLDRIENAPTKSSARQLLGIPDDRIAIALIPASRRQEVKYLLPNILEAAKQIQDRLPNVHFLIPVSLEAYRYPIEAAVKKYKLQATILEGKTLNTIAAADLAITKSGTVNLEIALLNVPQVVLYKVSPLTIWIARQIFNLSIPFMSPVNLLVMRSIVPELLQEEANPTRIAQEVLELLLDPQKRQQTLLNYQHMRSFLGEKGVCDRAAQEIFNFCDL